MILKRILLYQFAAISFARPFFCNAQDTLTEIPPDRYTSTVKLIEKSLPSVASIQTFKNSGTPGVYNIQVGSASVIHRSGYLLTNDHVVNGIAEGHATLPGNTPLPFRTVAQMSSEDLALIKVDAGHPLKPLPLGRSNDIMLGEPVITIGNPGGLNHSVSAGIVSGLNRSAATGAAFLPWMIQTSAAVSGGNSGGPLINALGEQIGTITSKKLDSENINFAISIDRVREVFPEMLSAELRFAFWLGIEIDMYKPEAEVKTVAERSPAQKAGITPGDIICRIGKSSIKNGFDFQFALIDRKPGEKLGVELLREKESLTLILNLTELELLTPIPAEGMVPGIHFEAFTGKWDKLPDFNSLKPVKTGQVTIPSESAFLTDDGENYGLRFNGYIKIPREGLYTFSTSSDDGSRLKIGDQIVVDNDGLHGVQSSDGRIRLRSGLHPISITFFENGGAQKLEIFYEGPELSFQSIPKEAFYTKANP